MTTEKMTYTKALETVLTAGKGVYSDEVMEKLEALKASLEKRAAAKVGKESKASKEAKEFAETVFAALGEKTEAVKCGMLATELGCNSQKVSAALSKLVKAGRVTKTTEKGTSLFKVAEAETEVEVEA